MLAAFRSKDTIELREVASSEPQENQVHIRIDACGVCGTDIHDDEPSSHRFGHEIAGVVTALGPGVTHVQVGQTVVLDSATPCGRCAMCKNGMQELCTDIQSFYYLDQFGFAEEMNVPAICVIPYEGLDPAVATLQEPLGVAIDLCRLSDITTTSNVLVIGQGPIGLMASALVRMHGARRLFVSDFASKHARKEMAQSLNIDRFIDAEHEDLREVLRDERIDRILVTAPPPAIATAIDIAAKGAILSFIGIGHGGTEKLTFDANAFHFKKLQLRASFASPAMYEPLALSYLREGRIDGNRMVSHRFPLSRISDALKVATDDPEALKVVVGRSFA